MVGTVKRLEGGKPKWGRRALVGGGVLGAAAVGIYRQAPLFWKQYPTEMFRPIEDAPHRPAPRQWADTGLAAAWLGHATCLVKLDGMVILTDPVFSPRCGIDMAVTTLGPKRMVKPALAIEELPKVDLVLLSHAHFDHWDLPSLGKLASKGTEVICARQTSDLLTIPHWKQVRELGWGERVRVGPLEVKGVEVKHWGARVRRDTHRGYNGYVVEAAGGKFLFGGDSAFTDKFKAVRGGRAIDLAIMPIGAYRPWLQNHCTPEQAIQMADWAGAERILPVHHKTFVLSAEPVAEPIERFVAGLGNNEARGVATDVGMQWAAS